MSRSPAGHEPSCRFEPIVGGYYFLALLRPLFTTILLASRSMFTVYEVFLLLVGAASSGRMLPRVGLRLNKICDVVLSRA